jgi:hypothetical protein
VKFLLTLLFGFVVGATVGAALIYFNPLTEERSPEINATATLAYGVEADSTLALTHGGQIKLPLRPREVAQLWEATIKRSALGVFLLKDEDGAQVAIGSRISQLSESSNLLINGIVQSDYWLISYPGRGTVYLEVDSNVWPLTRQTIVDVDLLGRDWSGPRRFEPTIGPAANGTAQLIGASGDFVGQYGSATETYTIERYEKGQVFLEGLLGRLDLRLSGDDERIDEALSAQ